MLYDVSTPEAYLEALDDDWRKETLNVLRELILKDSQVKETINYKMLAYGDGTDFIFHLNVQKDYVSLYVGDIKKVDPSGTLLEGLKTGKGCIRFSKSVSVADTQISTFIEKTIQLWKSGEDVSC